MVLLSKTFQIFKLATKSITTGITISIGGGGRGGTNIPRFYSSWVTSKSLFEELSAAAPSAPSTPSSNPQVRPPCLMLPATRDRSNGDMVCRFFNPINKKIFKIKKKKTDFSLLPNTARCFWSSGGLLAFIDPRDCGLYLRDPFYVSTEAVIRLPSIETFPTIVGTCRKSNKNRFIIQCWGEDRYHCSAREVSEFIIDKVVSSSAFAFYNNNNNNNHCLLMAIGGMEGSNLVFCKPGDTPWTALSGPLHPYVHIIPSSIKDKVFYAMSETGKIEAWDLRDLSCIKRTLIDYKRILCKPKFCQLEADLRAQFNPDAQKWYLVESSGDLLLVHRYTVDDGIYKPVSHHIPHKTIRFDVYKMDFSLEAWTYVNSLGDCALFVGLSNPFSVHVCDYPGLRPNSIYFSDDCSRTDTQGYLYGGHDTGVYNLEDNSIEPFYPFGHLKKIIPVPFWVEPNPHSENVAEWFA